MPTATELEREILAKGYCTPHLLDNLGPVLPEDYDIPPDLVDIIMTDDISCFGTARLILLAYGGIYAGRAIQVELTQDDLHVYVVLDRADLNRPALNQFHGEHQTNAWVLSNGIDITQWLFLQKWELL